MPKDVKVLMIDWDVITVGGSVSGLLAAKGVADAGHTVQLLEKDLEIGMPERCDGLVSMKCLEKIGIAPTNNIIQNIIKRAIFYSPSGLTAEIDASRQRVLVLDRSQFDRELAKIASKTGVDIKVGNKVINNIEKNGVVRVKSKSGVHTSKWIVNATGYSSLSNRKMTMQAAKFEVIGNWFDRDRVEIYFDQKKSPGYFIWVIPISNDTAKVGAAGNGVNQFKILDEFITAKGGTAIKKTAAQIVVGGPIENFISGHIVSVGDAAGQAKPTTGGGIYSGGIGGMLAGKYLGESLSSEDPSKVIEYENDWRNLFNKEFGLLFRARKVLERLDNNNIDKIFRAISSSDILTKISLESDFDYHSVALLRALGLKNIFQIADIVTGEKLDRIGSLLRLSKDIYFR
ncbi:MAG: NAD(P)/FAD-dependent oxidoreductase [Nitrososphaerales archaeon]|nr:NAD(P)/FAD-dependent oxidoreductase [Nitrososphaerales archaeon]